MAHVFDVVGQEDGPRAAQDAEEAPSTKEHPPSLGWSSLGKHAYRGSTGHLVGSGHEKVGRVMYCHQLYKEGIP